MTTATEAYITTAEAAERARVSLITFHRWMRCGLFGFMHKDRREHLVNEEEFMKFLAALRTPVSQSSP